MKQNRILARLNKVANDEFNLFKNMHDKTTSEIDSIIDNIYEVKNEIERVMNGEYREYFDSENETKKLISHIYLLEKDLDEIKGELNNALKEAENDL